ncbi:PilW family protein [Brassicibacter mesophilus]|uniref:PilW family protein n=1 Tax=Brassicibacter mesophilus TaxID=745119 RepID=UPI003D1E055D
MRLISCSYNKGFTIIELLISIALTGVVVSLIFSILIINSNMFYEADNDIELQQQGQFIIGFIEDKMIEASQVIYLEDMRRVAKQNTNEKVMLRKIIVKNHPNKTDKGYIFQLSKDTGTNTYNLKYGIGLYGSATVEAGNYIEKIEVEPIPFNKTYVEADGVTIILYLDVNGQKKTLKSKICFRNSHRR